ncbi:MAG: phosphoglycerate kinase [bacterium]
MYKRENLPALLEKASYVNAPLSSSRVLVRACLNVPLKNGVIQDVTRIEEALPLFKELQEQAKRVVIMAHLGRPEGIDPELSLKPVQVYLSEKLGEAVTLITSVSDEALNSRAVDYQKDKRFFLLENIRFFPSEKTKNEQEKINFAQQLANLGDIFINDAFPDYNESVSTLEVPKLMPAYFGPALLREVKAFSQLGEATHPYLAMLGGAKLSEKLDAMNALLESADQILIGGAMAYTLLAAKGIGTGNSLLEKDKIELAKSMLAKYGDKIVLPEDHVCVNEFKDPESPDAVTITTDQVIPGEMIAIDIGPKTVAKYVEIIAEAKTILWNGPMGVFEWTNAGQATKTIGEAIVANNQAFSIAGGGDSIAAINKYGLLGINHVSTGGGAMLAYLSYETFPVLDIILDKYSV